MSDRFEEQRERMVENTLVPRGVGDERVLAAMLTVPRHRFVPPEMAEFAYRDTPLPIEDGQTIAQPCLVAMIIEAAGLKPQDRLLEIGTGSGYVAAVASLLCREVYSVERHEHLCSTAMRRVHELGFTNVEVRCADSTQGLPSRAPFDAILVTGGGPHVPPALLEQLAPGGRLVIPLGPESSQRLVRFTREPGGGLRREELSDVRFVPLIGAEGWKAPIRLLPRGNSVSQLVKEACEPIGDLETSDLAPFLERIGDAKVVLLGEATHGSSEFYRWRARLTRELVLRRGFDVVAVEADWPDAARIDRCVRHRPAVSPSWRAFERFPQWLWRNQEVVELVEWMRAYNAEMKDTQRRVGFFGLDLYSLYISAHEVIRHLRTIDPLAAEAARARYGLLTPWQSDPGAYGRAALSGRYRAAEDEVVGQLTQMLRQRIETSLREGDKIFEALNQAQLVVDADRYYRAMYYGSGSSWNLRDQHMFDSLLKLLEASGPQSRAVVWAHNAHVGDASATEMGRQGEFNIGQLCRQEFGEGAWLVGFGTHHGAVAAAHNWDEPMEVMQIRPGNANSYERICHDSGVPAFSLPLRHPRREEVRDELMKSRLERAIGVIYRPQAEMRSHYFEAVLPHQFDEFVWFDETHAIRPLPGPATASATPDNWPFGA